MAHDVFISHSAKNKETADTVCARLESNGIRCWIAPRDVLPGVPYGEALGEALRDSQILLLVFSSNSNRSGQVMREVESAVDKGIPILPFRIENVQPSASLDYFVKAIHWLDAITPPLEKHLQSLAGVVRLLLTRQQSGTVAPGSPGATDSGPKPGEGAPPAGPAAWQPPAAQPTSEPRSRHHRTEEHGRFPAPEEARRQGDAAAFWFLLAGIGVLADLTGFLAFPVSRFLIAQTFDEEKQIAFMLLCLTHGPAVACHFLASGSMKNFRGKGKVIAAIISGFVLGLLCACLAIALGQDLLHTSDLLSFLWLLVATPTSAVNFIAAIRGILVLKSGAVREEFGRPEKTRPEPTPVFSRKLVIGLAGGLLSWFLVALWFSIPAHHVQLQ